MFTNTKRLIEQFIQARNAPGAVMMCGDQKHTYGPYAFGTTSFFPHATPVRPDTLFDLASLTKVVATTTLALRFLEEGQFRLDDTIGHFFPRVGPDKRNITVRQLLTHTSGLPAWAQLYAMIDDPARVVESIFQLELSSSPGTKVEYSCIGFILLGKLLEILGGNTLDKLVHEVVLKPIGMESACYNPKVDRYASIAYTEWATDRKEFLCGLVHDENARSLRGVSGNAGLFGTAEDLAKFAQMIIGDGSNLPSLLRKETLALLRKNYTYGLGENRTLGWMHLQDSLNSGGDLLSPLAIGHTGFTGTSLWIDLKLGRFFILLTNRVHPTRENPAIIRFRPLFHNSAISEFPQE